MGIGDIKLAAYSRKDVILMGNPSMTFFKTVYRRHSMFITQEYEHSFSSAIGFAGSGFAWIPSNGDMLSDLSIIIDMPQLESLSRDLFYKYVDYPALALIKKISFEINNKTVVEIDGTMLWHQLESSMYNSMAPQVDLANNRNTETHRSGVEKLLGQDVKLQTFANVQPAVRWQIPLNLWFSQQPSLFLPLVNLDTKSVRLNVVLHSLEHIVLFGPTHVLRTTDPCIFPNWSQLQVQSNLTGRPRFNINSSIINKRFQLFSTTRQNNITKLFVNCIGDGIDLNSSELLLIDKDNINSKWNGTIEPLETNVFRCKQNLKRYAIRKIVVLSTQVTLSQQERRVLVGQTNRLFVSKWVSDTFNPIGNNLVQRLNYKSISSMLCFSFIMNENIKYKKYFSFSDVFKEKIGTISLAINSQHIMDKIDSNILQVIQHDHGIETNNRNNIYCIPFSFIPLLPTPTGHYNMAAFTDILLTTRLSEIFLNLAGQINVYDKINFVCEIRKGELIYV